LGINNSSYFGRPVLNCHAHFVIITEGAKGMFESNGFEIDRFGKAENGQIINRK